MTNETIYNKALSLLIEIPLPKQGKGCEPMADYVMEMRLAVRIVNRIYIEPSLKKREKILGELNALVQQIKESD
jgi:hypothetical protein